MHIGQNLDLVTDLFFVFLFFFFVAFFLYAFPFYSQFCYPPYRLSFAWNVYSLTFQERGKFNLQRVVSE